MGQIKTKRKDGGLKMQKWPTVLQVGSRARRCGGDRRPDRSGYFMSITRNPDAIGQDGGRRAREKARRPGTLLGSSRTRVMPSSRRGLEYGLLAPRTFALANASDTDA